MDTTIPAFQRPIETENEPESHIHYWDDANDAYNHKEYRKALISIIHYINPNVLTGKNIDNNIDITYHHGSTSIQLTINEHDFTVRAPFLKINRANQIAIMRKVAEINFFPLNLSQIILKEDVLSFYYCTTIDLCHPMKIYDVIREICLCADNYDDEFIKLYHADHYKPPHINKLTLEQMERVWQSFQTTANQYEHYREMFEKNLLHGSMWDIIAISMLMIAIQPYVHGTLRTDLDKALAVHYDTDLDIDYRLDVGKSFLKQLFTKTSKEHFLDNIYLAQTFISVKARSSVNILKGMFEENKHQILKDINDGNTFAAAYTMQLFFLRLIYDYNLDNAHRIRIFDALERSSGKKSKVAAPILWDTYQAFMQGKVSGDSNTGKGFFSRLFG